MIAMLARHALIDIHSHTCGPNLMPTTAVGWIRGLEFKLSVPSHIVAPLTHKKQLKEVETLYYSTIVCAQLSDW